MNNEPQNSDLNQTPLFNVNPNELFNIARIEYKYELNKLSPFFGQPVIGTDISKEMSEMSKDSDFKLAVKIISSPSARLKFCKGGAGFPIENFSAYIGKINSVLGAVVLMEGNMALTLLFFKNIRQFAQFFVAQNASLVTNEPVNLIPDEVTLGTVISIFNYMDCIKRAYLNNLLEMSEAPIKGILELDYVSILRRALKSGDIRWLTPSFIRLTPELLKYQIEFKEDQFEILEKMKFLSKIEKIDDKGTRILIPGTNGKFMGLEFTHFWKWSIGFDINILEKGKKEISKCGLYYMAPTEEGNHLFEIIPQQEQDLKIYHSVYSYTGLQDKILTIIEKLSKLVE